MFPLLGDNNDISLPLSIFDLDKHPDTMLGRALGGGVPPNSWRYDPRYDFKPQKPTNKNQMRHIHTYIIKQ